MSKEAESRDAIERIITVLFKDGQSQIFHNVDIWSSDDQFLKIEDARGSYALSLASIAEYTMVVKVVVGTSAQQHDESHVHGGSEVVFPESKDGVVPTSTGTPPTYTHGTLISTAPENLSSLKGLILS